ncbi:MAG TPA: putative glycolipid-binding domain-containing protein [Pseudomonas sp.]|nr:putative glycolipid-binding domain-containing protein [Pseudomonas sp.]
MQTVVHWCNWEKGGLDHCSLDESSDSLVIEGIVIGIPIENYAAHYYVRADGHLRTREVRIEFVGGPRLHLAADGEGSWRDMLSNEPIPLLAGCLDVDIAVTPATNTLPIKRLALEEGESRDIIVAYIPLHADPEHELLPEVMKQSYTCLYPNKRYRYKSAPHGFTAELEIDEFGLVLDYPEVFRRCPI